MDYRSYPNTRQPWESYEQFEYRMKIARRAQEEEELKRMHKSLSLYSSISEMSGIGVRTESYQEFCARINRERAEVELQEIKQDTKKLILLLL